jgi:hypothetical protein
MSFSLVDFRRFEPVQKPIIESREVYKIISCVAYQGTFARGVGDLKRERG